MAAPHVAGAMALLREATVVPEVGFLPEFSEGKRVLVKIAHEEYQVSNMHLQHTESVGVAVRKSRNLTDRFPMGTYAPWGAMGYGVLHNGWLEVLMEKEGQVALTVEEGKDALLASAKRNRLRYYGDTGLEHRGKSPNLLLYVGKAPPPKVLQNIMCRKGLPTALPASGKLEFTGSHYYSWYECRDHVVSLGIDFVAIAHWPFYHHSSSSRCIVYTQGTLMDVYPVQFGNGELCGNGCLQDPMIKKTCTSGPLPPTTTTTTMLVTIYQPAEQGGHYAHRSVGKYACELIQKGCWNLDDLTCADGRKCLKWGSHCYAGRISVPAGVKVDFFKIAWWQSWNDACKHHADITPTSVVGPQHLRNFWNHHHRVCAFRFSLQTGYTCKTSQSQPVVDN